MGSLAAPDPAGHFPVSGHWHGYGVWWRMERQHRRGIFSFSGKNRLDARSWQHDQQRERRRAFRCAAGRDADHGHGGGDHQPLTLAWMRLVAAALVETPEGYTFEQFISAHPQLKVTKLLDKYYSKELLQTAAAREGWV